MQCPLPTLLLLSLLTALPACGKLRVVDVPEPDDSPREAPATTARPAANTGSAWASQLALDACRSEIARRWRVPENGVRTSTRAHNSDDRTDLVNWDMSTGAAGFCRVDERGTVLNVETERAGTPRSEIARDSAPATPVPDPAPEPTPSNHPLPPAADPSELDAEPEPPGVAREQLEACRSTVVREMRARPDEVGLSAGTPDERGTVLIDWSLGTGSEGTCRVDSTNTVVQFRR
jgi:hypothetical protein